MLSSSARSKKVFSRLVDGLKGLNKTLTVVESSCGGTINSSIMSIPGSSAVFYGGSVAYNTKRAKKLLLDDATLHGKLTDPMKPLDGESEGDAYIRSKLRWTAETAIEFCKQMDVDYAIAEGGATGPTFRPEGMNKGFAVIAIAGRKGGQQKGGDDVSVLAQKVVHSTHADREANMRFFADAAADLAIETIGIPEKEMNATASVQQQSSLSSNSSSDAPSLCRATALRSDEEAIRKLEQRKDAKHVILKNADECLFSSPNKLSLLSQEELEQITNGNSSCKTFLGLDNDDVPIFGVDLLNVEGSGIKLPTPSNFANTRVHAPFLSPLENELALYATAMAQWKKSHKFCNGCGKPVEPIHGGTCLKCTNCESLSWPRQDPSIIVLITDRNGDKALLARSKRHPPKLHTALAGFVEAGETFERAVSREAREETGAHVDSSSIRYIASQPWPFPRSSMIGFRATADDGIPLTIDYDELVDAKWFDKDAVIEATKVPGAVMNKDVAQKVLEENPSLELLVPPQGVLARTLIDSWLQEKP